MLFSQNGWSANDYSLMATFTVPTTSVRLTLRKGDASVVLLYVAEQFHKTVEPLIAGQCGGYNPRSIIGAKTISNHGSGTAEDLNWTRHARGKRNTFTKKQVAAIRAILAFVNQDATVIRWGGDYKSAPVDDMHFEVIGTPAQTAKAADRIRNLRAGPAKQAEKTTVHEPGTRVLKLTAPPMTGKDVGFLQRWLGLEDDEVFGSDTKAKVVAYQRMRGLEPDAVVGAATWSAVLGRTISV